MKVGYLRCLYADWEISIPFRAKKATDWKQKTPFQGQTQKRGAHGKDGKFRIIFEARRAVLQWFAGYREKSSIPNFAKSGESEKSTVANFEKSVRVRRALPPIF